jgi:chromosome segregation ATPase
MQIDADYAQLEGIDTDIERFEIDPVSAGAPAADEAQTDAIMAELDAATAGLVAFRARIEELTRARRAAEEELAQCRSELDTLREARASDRMELAELEQKLSRERGRVAIAREKFTDVLNTLDD